MKVGKYYTEELFNKLHAVKKPYNFRVELIESGNALGLVIYEDDWQTFTENQQKLIIEYLSELQNIVKDAGIRCFVDGVATQSTVL